MRRKLQYPGAGSRNLVRLQKYQIRRRLGPALTSINELRRPPHGSAVLPRARVFDLDLQRPVRLSLCGTRRHPPDMPAGRDVAALNQRAAADKTLRRFRRIDVD